MNNKWESLGRRTKWSNRYAHYSRVKYSDVEKMKYAYVHWKSSRGTALMSDMSREIVSNVKSAVEFKKNTYSNNFPSLPRGPTVVERA